ncbi:MAG: SatD family protein [Agathobacter sp.]|nr:SatD family protein [Agathobacter sp.]
MEYFAIIGDIVCSKLIEDRLSVQKQLNSVLDKVNSEYAKEIASRFIITLGDEFQGLLSSGENVVEIAKLIQNLMYPVKIRFGIGLGEIATDINPEMAIGADGPAYYYARDAINMVEATECQNKIQAADIIVKSENSDEVIQLINNNLMLIHVIEQSWTKRQRQIVNEIQHLGGNQSLCANKLGISQSTVQRALIGASYYAYRDSMELFKRILKEK